LALSMSERAAQLTADPLELARIARIQGRVASERGQTRQAHEIMTAAADSIAELDPPAAALLLAETIVAGRHDAALAGKAFTRLCAITSPGDAAILTAHDPAVLAVEMLMRTYEWTLSVRNGSGPRQDTLNAAVYANLSGDYDAARDLGLAAAAECRATGLISRLPFVQAVLGATEIQLGRFHDAATTATDGLQLADATSQPLQAATLNGTLARLAAVQGEEQRCRELATQSVRGFARTDNPTGGTWAEWALALLDLGAGRWDAAFDRLETTARTPGHRAIALVYFAADQIEAAVRLGQPGRAGQAMTRLTEWMNIASRQPANEAVLLRCRALTDPGEATEDYYLAALRLHASSGRAYHWARTELLYGEWLRRARRSSEARGVLLGALERFGQVGAALWTDRARAELRAAGGKAFGTQAPTGAVSQLTSQELQVVRLAAAGETNRDIAARLFLSPRTISHHLYRAFPKLGVTTRTELAHLDLPGRADEMADNRLEQ
jgi:DNA-binding CsgD family transcriptional regulator